MHDFPIEKKVSQLQNISYLFLIVLSFIVLFVVIEWINQNRFIEDLAKQIIDNNWSIEDINTRLSNIDPLESLIFQWEETQSWQYVFEYEKDWMIMTWAVINTSVFDLESLK